MMRKHRKFMLNNFVVLLLYFIPSSTARSCLILQHLLIEFSRFLFSVETKKVRTQLLHQDKKEAHYGRGKVSIAKPVEAGVVSDKGNVKGHGGQPLKMAGNRPITGTMQGMGAAKKGGKYTWTGTNNTKW